MIKVEEICYHQGTGSSLGLGNLCPPLFQNSLNIFQARCKKARCLEVPWQKGRSLAG